MNLYECTCLQRGALFVSGVPKDKIDVYMVRADSIPDAYAIARSNCKFGEITKVELVEGVPVNPVFASRPSSTAHP